MSRSRVTSARLSLSLVGLLCAVVTGGPAHAWGVGHNDASRLAAGISPEPLASNPDLCLFAHYPDAIQDHAVGHGRDGYLRRLLTFEALDALRAGDMPKALFLASAATHYLTDRSCIAHSGRAWYHQDGDVWTKYLPRRYQGVKVPFERKDVYYPHLQGTAKDTVLGFPEPEYAVEQWRQFQGSTNAYFDSMPSVRRFVTPDLLRRPTGWTFTDFDQYARWYGVFISLDMIDPASLGTDPLRLRDATGMKAVCVEELVNGAAQDAAYYGYLATAAKTTVEPSLAELLSTHDKLLSLLERETVVLIPQSASWPVERAANVLGMELLRAARRQAKLGGLAEPDRTPASFVSRVAPESLEAKLQGRNAILLLAPGDAAWLTAAGAPPLPDVRSGLVAARRADDGALQILLRGATEQDTLYLVDYLLDLAWDPLHGRWPAETVTGVLQDLWGGWKLILDLRGRSGQAAVDYAVKLPYRHQETRAEDAKAYTERLREGIYPAADEEEWWRWFLLELPLPDGRRVPDLIETGTDYTALMRLVSD